MLRTVASRLAPIGPAVLIFALSSRRPENLPSFEFPGLDKLAHVLVYLPLGLTLSLSTGRSTLLCAVLGVLYGLTDEFHQSFVPGRQPDFGDVIADGVGAALGAHLFETFWGSRRAPHVPR